MSNNRSGFADINGARLYYEEAGQGFPLIFVHAGIADSRMWDDQFPVFAEKYHVVRYDQRGYGQSAMVPGPFSPYDDLRGLMDFLGIQRAFLVGCSMGGGAIIDFAIEHPERAAALVPVGSALSGFQFEGDPPPFWEDYEQAEKAGNIDLVAEYAARIWVDSTHRTPEQVDPAVRAKVIDMVRMAMRNPQDLGHPHPLDPPATDRLDQLKLPMLIIVGDLDDPNIMHIADTLASAVPGAKKVVMEGTAHLPNMERPEEFNQLAMSFLEAQS